MHTVAPMRNRMSYRIRTLGGKSRRANRTKRIRNILTYSFIYFVFDKFVLAPVAPNHLKWNFKFSDLLMQELAQCCTLEFRLLPIAAELTHQWHRRTQITRHSVCAAHQLMRFHSLQLLLCFDLTHTATTKSK